jgi:3-oxoacyl-[acyl-carrier protein] reductase
MPNDLQDKVALVTGGARGIGRGVAQALLDAGARVAVASRTQPDLDEAQAVLDAGDALSTHRCDVADPVQVERLFDAVVERRGRLDVLVCSHGVYPGVRSLVDIPLDEYEHVMAVNVRGVFLCAQVAARLMLERDEEGRIIVVSSMNALSSQEGAADYDASKAAVHGLVRAFAVELAPRGITVNAVAPGWVRTPMSEEELDHLAGQTLNPSRRVGEPADIAKAVLWLADPENGYVNGQVTVVDGGQTAMLPLPWSDAAASGAGAR